MRPAPKRKKPIAVLIGGGSKLPAIYKASQEKNSNFYIALVISHKKVSKGVKFALSKNIPAVYFNLPDFRKKVDTNSKNAKEGYMKFLGWFISQKTYSPKLLIFAGWDLIVDKNFLSFFKTKIGEGYAAINLHPALMPTKKEGKIITLPDGTKTKVIKGVVEEVLATVLKNNCTYFGPSIHFMVANNYDVGEVIQREFIKVGKNETVTSLRKKLDPAEDRILISSINQMIQKL